MRVFVGTALGILAIAATAGAEPLSLEAAKREGVRVEVAEAHGYQGVAVTFHNAGHAAVEVRVAPGVVFENQNAQEQDLTLSSELRVWIRPGETVTRTVGSYCIRPNDGPPTSGARFSVNGVDPDVAALLQGRESKAPDPGVQSAVWRHLSARSAGSR